MKFSARSLKVRPSRAKWPALANASAKQALTRKAHRELQTCDRSSTPKSSIERDYSVRSEESGAKSFRFEIWWSREAKRSGRVAIEKKTRWFPEQSSQQSERWLANGALFTREKVPTPTANTVSIRTFKSLNTHTHTPQPHITTYLHIFHPPILT